MRCSRSPMVSDSYYYRASKSNVVRIGLSQRDASWAVWLNDRLLDDGFESPEDAAFAASRKNFATQLANNLLSGVHVPEDLSRWRTTPPDLPSQLATHNPPIPSDCKNR